MYQSHELDSDWVHCSLDNSPGKELPKEFQTFANEPVQSLSLDFTKRGAARGVRQLTRVIVRFKPEARIDVIGDALSTKYWAVNKSWFAHRWQANCETGELLLHRVDGEVRLVVCDSGWIEAEERFQKKQTENVARKAANELARQRKGNALDL